MECVYFKRGLWRKEFGIAFFFLVVISKHVSYDSLPFILRNYVQQSVLKRFNNTNNDTILLGSDLTT
jgi:hypothetical protein